MSTATTNGKPRKLLADQLDRLDEQLAKHDSVIDALSEGLNGAVADAARDGVKEAVKLAVIEMMTSPDLRAALHQATAPPPSARPTLWQRVRATARKAVADTVDVTNAVVAAVATRVTAVRDAATGTAARAGIAWRLRKVLLVGLGVGLTVAAVSYVTTHGVAAVLSGAGAAATAVAVQAGLWVRRTVRRLAAA